MCSILGVSFAPGSTINRKKLTQALLIEGRSRGRDASGYAWVDGATGESGLFKNNVPGDRLYLGDLPESATAIIAHTRAATHGTAKDMDNNHPFESTSGKIRMVHNGVIWNEQEVRTYFDKKTQKAMPEVDSSVIAEVIDQFGLDSTNVIEGSAAVAWFDKDTGDTIHLAKFDNSPVHFAFLYDGSFVFASTASILAGALKAVHQSWIGSYPAPFDSMADGDYFQIMGAEILEQPDVEWGDTYKSRSSYYNNKYDAITSGKTSQTGYVASNYDTRVGTPAVNPSVGVTSPAVTGQGFGIVKEIEANKAIADAKDSQKKKDELDAARRKAVESINPEAKVLTNEDGSLNDLGKEVLAEFRSGGSEDSTAMVFQSDLSPEYDDPDYVDTADDYDWYPADGAVPPFSEPLYFSYGHDGDYKTYNALQSLITDLSWSSKLTGGENLLVDPEDGYLRWVNHFENIGILSEDMTDEISWVHDQGAFADYQSRVPSWVGDGVSRLRQLVGA